VSGTLSGTFRRLRGRRACLSCRRVLQLIKTTAVSPGAFGRCRQRKVRHKLRIERIEQDDLGRLIGAQASANMSMQPLKPNAEHRAVHKTWRPNLIMFWSFVVVVAVVARTILAVDSTLTTEQRIEMALHSGMFP
jgi:hypothetical protein